MPQFIRAQGMDPALVQMGQQIATANNQAMERSRLNAGNYLKNLRADAQAAGYSLSEWAKKNESGVKGALFTVSGRNRDVAESKFQELINGPENFNQKQQRLEDQYVSTTSNNLMGAPDKVTTTTSTIKGSPAMDNPGMTTEVFRNKVKEAGYTNLIDAGKAYFGADADLNYKQGKGSPEALKFWKWRTEAAKSLGIKDFVGSPDQNNKIFAALMSPSTGTSSDFRGMNNSVAQDPLDNKIDAMATTEGWFKGLPHSSNDRGRRMLESGYQYKESNVDELKKSPALVAAVRKALDTGDKAMLTNFAHWSPEGLKKLIAQEITNDTTGGVSTDKITLPSLSFGQTVATPDRTVTETKITPGEPGFLDEKQAYYDNLVGRGVSQADVVSKEQALRAADTADAKNKAATALQNAQSALIWEQVAQTKIPPGVSTDNYFKLFQAQQEDMFKQYPPEKALKITADSPAFHMYVAKLNTLVNTARSAGMFVDTQGTDAEAIKIKAKNWFENKGTLPVITDIAPAFRTGRIDLGGVQDNVNSILSNQN